MWHVAWWVLCHLFWKITWQTFTSVWTFKCSKVWKKSCNRLFLNKCVHVPNGANAQWRHIRFVNYRINDRFMPSMAVGASYTRNDTVFTSVYLDSMEMYEKIPFWLVLTIAKKICSWRHVIHTEACRHKRHTQIIMILAITISHNNLTYSVIYFGFDTWASGRMWLGDNESKYDN